MTANPLNEILRDEIRHGGPIPFRRFMEAALYHPEYGYYRRARDPFGAAGDYFTAEQVQPVFGRLIAARVRQWFAEAGSPGDFTVAELGAGRREMAGAFAEWRYVPVDVDGGTLPERFRGVVFSNEFFDALPVDVAEWSGGAFREMLVGMEDEAFAWVRGGEATAAIADYVTRYFPAPEEGRLYEANLAALEWIERIGRSSESGWVVTIDYGYTRPEWLRFPRGTLMSYRRHAAREQVLENPGAQDITAHVNFTALQEHGSAHGLQKVQFENLARTLLDAGEPDSFASALAGGTRAEEMKHRLQLKTLLFGMGETFRVLIQRRE